MKSTKQIGDTGEDLAVVVLEKAGYKIIERNFRTRFGEIDIIAKEGETFVFVEVKAKSGSRFGKPAEMITKKKKQKLKNMSLFYVSENRYKGPWRIDAVVIEGDSVEILKNISLDF